MSGEIFSDGSMLEIFRAEVETHVESLTSGLLALERDPENTSNLAEMMRGAHSIKGAARIVGIDPAVKVAHVMEDGFVAAQNGKLTLRPAHVDVLLRGVDMLNRIANASKDLNIDWGQFDSEAIPLVAEITSVLAGTTAAIAIPVRPSEKAADQPETVPAAQTQTRSSATANDVTIQLPKMLDAAAADNARLAFVAGLDSNAKMIRFDLTKTADLDATGLAFLVAVPSNISDDGPRVELVGASSDLQLVLEATGIDRLYPSGGR